VNQTTRVLGHVGTSLLAGALVCAVVAWWAASRPEQSFYDNLDNEVTVVRDSVLVLGTLGVVLALNGLVLLWLRHSMESQERRRLGLRKR